VRQAIVWELRVGDRTIGTTAEHPFYVHERGWTAAGELEAGDLLATGDGRWIAVEACYNTGRFETVYNFRIADHHTYFVEGGEWGFAVWVHNSYGQIHRIATDKSIKSGWAAQSRPFLVKPG